MEFDELTLESFIWENTMRAADAVAPNLPYPPQECLPVRDIQLLARSKCRCRRRSTPPRRDADIAAHSGFFFVCMPAPHQGFVEGSTYGESTVH